MEDFLPMHGFDTMDIAIPQSFSSSSLAFMPTTLAIDEPDVVPNGFTVQIENSATGFVIAKPKRKFWIGTHLVSGLVLTAAHAVADVYEKLIRKLAYNCRLELTALSGARELSYCVPILHFLNEVTIPSESSLGTQYMCPNDFAILCLVSNLDLNQLITYPICTSLEVNAECIVSGYPGFSGAGYTYPSKKHDEKDIEAEINKTFCRFEGRINSRGPVSCLNENLGEIKCSTTSGMSGAPVMKVNADGTKEICGVYVGGPPLPIQYECLDLARNVIASKDYDSASMERLFEVCHDVYRSDPNILDFLNDLRTVLIRYAARKSGDSEYINMLANSLSRKVVASHPSLLSEDPRFYFNSFLPFTHPLFQKIADISVEFEEIDQDFGSMEEFLAYVSK